jgi:hypothetical protein
MDGPPYDPQVEPDALSIALTHGHEQKDLRQRVHAALRLSAVVEHAEHVLAMLEPQQDPAASGFQLHVDGLRTLLLLARAELSRAERVALTAMGNHRANETPAGKALDTSFAVGTLISCRCCGEGLYKVSVHATTTDLVLDDGTCLTPFNRLIPARGVWTPLACPRCGGRLLQAGTIHTVQHGWRSEAHCYG